MDLPPTNSAVREPSAWKSRLILALLTGFPAVGFVQKYAGLPGVVAYLAGVIAVMFAAGHLAPRFVRPLETHFRLISIVAIAGLLGAFLWLHPFEDNKGPGKSSDRDEALELAVTRLAAGETPYYPAGNPQAGPLSVLPGSILLAAPFVALGNVGAQNVAWLAALLFALAWRFKNPALALALVLVPLAVSPAALYEFISGGDLIANGIFVALGFLFALHAWLSPSSPVWRRCLACGLLGIALASRPNFLLLAPLFVACLWRARGPKQALFAGLLTGLTSAALIVPFYLHDPMGFTPLKAKQKLAVADALVPWASQAMIGLTLLTALLAAGWLWRKRGGEMLTDFFRGCTLVTLAPMLGAIALATYAHGGVDFDFMRDRFGLMYLFFALFGWGGGWFAAVSRRAA